MNDEEKAVARSCLRQIESGMAELAALKSWWRMLGPDKREEFEVFLTDVLAYDLALR